jgi:hypothetical protein
MIESIKLKKQMGIKLSYDEAHFILQKSIDIRKDLISRCGNDLVHKEKIMGIYINHMMDVFPMRDVGQAPVTQWMYRVLDRLGI